jgi:alkanesulfonate monooxygenase SsuD/methylene tetrahydromethanopterin reductase-like flavin-dependent oxidoreductase (luciferase family)
MRIGVTLDDQLGLSFGELREAAREAERLGFDSLWAPSGGVPDAFHVCAAWAWDTPLTTGISVVPVARVMWSPQALALQAVTVARIAADGARHRGREPARPAPHFVLGLGTGGAGSRFWAAAGMPDKPVMIMRDYATAIKKLLAGQAVTYEGPGVRLREASIAAGATDVPVYLAALGPQMLRLAGQVADGALLNWATPGHVARSREQVAAGAAQAGRDPGSVAVGMSVKVCVDDDVAAARRVLGRQVLRYALSRPDRPPTTSHRGMFTRMGFDDVLKDLEGRRDRGESADALADHLPDNLLNSLGYYGPAEGAPAAYARLAASLDESTVRVLTVRPGNVAAVFATLAALNPAAIRGA